MFLAVHWTGCAISIFHQIRLGFLVCFGLGFFSNIVCSSSLCTCAGTLNGVPFISEAVYILSLVQIKKSLLCFLVQVSGMAWPLSSQVGKLWNVSPVQPETSSLNVLSQVILQRDGILGIPSLQDCQGSVWFSYKAWLHKSGAGFLSGSS